MVEGVAPISVAQETNPLEHDQANKLSDRLASWRLQDSRAEEEIFSQLADMVAATTISDGPPTAEAPHRLWTSRDAHQANIASTLPSSIIGASVSDLEHGVRAVFQTGILGQTEPAAWRGGRRNTASGRVHLSRSARAKITILSVSDKATALAEELKSLGPVDHSDIQALEMRYNVLDSASKTTSGLSQNLSTVRRRKKTDYIAELASARGSLRQLDSIINLLGSSLPSRTMAEPPVIETGMCICPC